MPRVLVPLAEAGYRERAFFKSYLADSARYTSELWKQMNGPDGARYDGSSDRIVWRLPSGREATALVMREGTESKALLESLGLDDADCVGEWSPARFGEKLALWTDQSGQVTAEAMAARIAVWRERSIAEIETAMTEGHFQIGRIAPERARAVAEAIVRAIESRP